MEELQKKAERPYKVCFLGYSKLSEVAREVIDSLPDNDVEYVLMDSNLENQDACVEEARQLGCSVFVAGPGNAARFSTHYDDPLVEITIRYIDYAIALRAVTTTDFMTAESAEIPWDVIGKTTSRIVNEVKHINRVMYDCTGKPPATIEFE